MNGDPNSRPTPLAPPEPSPDQQQPDQSPANNFTPLKPKNPDSESQRAIVDKYNSFRQNGGLDSDLSYQNTQDVLTAAEGGNPRVTEQDALSNPDTYFQQVYKQGKTPKLLSQSVQTGEFWANLVPNIVVGGAGLLKDLAVGGAQRLGDELQAYNPLLTQEQRSEHVARLNIATIGAAENAWIMPQRLINGVSDMAKEASLHSQLSDPNLTADQRDKLEHQESEIFRERQVREKAFQGQVDGANKDLAGIYRTIGLTDQARVVMTDPAQPKEEQKALMQAVMDPTNIITEGVGALVSRGGGLFIKSGVRTLALEDAVQVLNEAEKTSTALTASRAALEARIASATDDIARRDLQTELARQVPEERNAVNAVTQAKGAASELSNAVKTQMDQIVPGGVVRKLTGNTFGALGNAIDAIAGGMEKLKGVSESSAARIAGPGADEGVKAAVADQMNGWVSDAVKGAAAHATDVVGAGIGSAIGVGPVVGMKGAQAVRAGMKFIFNPDNVRAFARDFKIIGPQLSLGRQTLPFFKSVSEKTTGVTSAIASKLDNQLIYSIPDIVRGTAAGTATGAALGFVSGGGETDPTVQGAAGGFMFGLAGGGLGQIGKFNSPGALHSARIGDRSRFMATLGQDDRPMFNRLRADEQLAVSVYAMAHPDLHIKFFDDPKGLNGSHYVDDRGPVVTLNVAGDNPLKAIFEHEIGHHVASHDLTHVVTDYMVGNVMKGEPGIFTKYGDDGKPIMDIDPATQKMSYMPNEAFTKYGSEYNARKGRDFPNEPPEDTHGIAQEIFAELHAAAFKDPAMVQKMVRGFVPSDLVSGNVLANWFGKMGMAYDPITGTPLSGPEVAKVRGLMDMVTRYHKDRAYKNNPMEHEGGQTRIGPETWRANPEVIYRNLDGAGILTRDPKTGDIVKGADGLPIIKSSKEADAEHAQLTKAVVDYLRANPRLEGHVGDNVMKLVTDRDGRQFYRGIMPQEVIDHIAAQNAYNPYQIQNLRKLNDIAALDEGQMVLINHNTPQKGGKYASLAMKERAVVPIHLEVSPSTGQTMVKAYDPEQMTKHVAKMVRRPKGQELWGGKVNPALEDVNTYLGNLANGRPGEAEIGLSKKAIINELFGFPNTANPSISDIAKRPTNQSVLKSFRIDRINRVRETSGVSVPFHEQTYEQVRAYAQPRLGFEGVPEESPVPAPVVAAPAEPFAHLPDKALPQLSDVAHVQHLPGGAHFLDPKGVRRKKPHG